jgi:hypothetical protein
MNERSKKYPKVWVLHFRSPAGSYRKVAWTKSEARAMVKREMGIDRKGRLPIGVEIEVVS